MMRECLLVTSILEGEDTNKFIEQTIETFNLGRGAKVGEILVCLTFIM